MALSGVGCGATSTAGLQGSAEDAAPSRDALHADQSAPTLDTPTLDPPTPDTPTPSSDASAPTDDVGAPLPDDVSTTADVSMERPDGGITPPPRCVPMVSRGSEATDALCSDGVDNDCNGYIDCRDFNCSRNAAVSVCDRGDAGVDAPPPADVTPPVDVALPLDAPTDPGVVGPMGGSVDLMRFGVFGDMRPPFDNATTQYPTAIVTAVMDGFVAEAAQFAVATGDYMFANSTATVGAQVSMLLGVEARFAHHIFHGMGNHECNGASTSNCPIGNEMPNIIAFRTRLAPGYGAPYYDFVVQTRLGDAHFVITAPNAWSTTQQAWLTRTLSQTARYTIVEAHEPAGEREAPGSQPIEDAIRARPGGVTLRLYGHTHEYRHMTANAVIAGNAGAPLASTSGSYGFVMVAQRADGNLVVTAYDVGRPPMVVDSFVLTPGGALTR